jgi:hypothetical protein
MSRQRAGLSSLVRRDLGISAERGRSRKMVCLSERRVDGALQQLETKSGRFQTGHRTGGGGRVSEGGVCLLCLEADA